MFGDRFSKKRRQVRREKAARVTEQELRDAAIRQSERKLRQARRDARELNAKTARSLPLSALAWIGTITTCSALGFLLALGAPSPWVWLCVGLSGLFTVVVVIVDHRHKTARVGVSLRSRGSNGAATNLAVLLAALQILGAVIGLINVIETKADTGGPTTTIIEEKVCPVEPQSVFPAKRS
jgi:hypothetical protein